MKVVRVSQGLSSDTSLSEGGNGKRAKCLVLGRVGVINRAK
jgi:hypothetical protein